MRAPRIVWFASSCFVGVFLVAALVSAGESRVTYQRVHGPGLESNLLGDSADRDVMVYLPPSYVEAADRRYPTVYLLHGYNGTSTIWRDGSYQGFSIQRDMDALIREGRVREMIVVMPDGRNAYGGTYFVNSVVTGNWEDFVAKDLVAYMDQTYRTLPSPESRAIAGQSMGGYSAIYIGMKNPDVFSAVYGLSSCCLDIVADVKGNNPEWIPTLKLENRADLLRAHLETPSKGNYQNALTALAAAVSPNPDRAPLYVDYPFKLVDGKVERNEAIYQKWLEHFPVHMVEEYRSNLFKLKGLRFIAGVSDHLQHIPLGSLKFSQALTEAGVPHEFELDHSDHRENVREWLETKVFPFFSLVLTHQNGAWYKPEGF